jgi:hypothetical protein
VAARSGKWTEWVPEPGEDDGGAFAETDWKVDELAAAGSPADKALGFGVAIAFPGRHPPLVAVRRVPGRRLED